MPSDCPRNHHLAVTIRRAYFALDSVARIIHGDLPPMLVGGLGSRSFRCSIPHHGRRRPTFALPRRPPRRLLQTANFIGFTTYGTRSEAYASIERVLAVHQVVLVSPTTASLLRERSAPPGVGPRRRDLDVPHGLHALRRGAIERRRRRSLRARNGEPWLSTWHVDPPTSVAALEATIQRSGRNASQSRRRHGA